MGPSGSTRCGWSGSTRPGRAGVEDHLGGRTSRPSSTRMTPHTPGLVRCSRRRPTGSVFSSNAESALVGHRRRWGRQRHAHEGVPGRKRQARSTRSIMWGRRVGPLGDGEWSSAVERYSPPFHGQDRVAGRTQCASNVITKFSNAMTRMRSCTNSVFVNWGISDCASPATKPPCSRPDTAPPSFSHLESAVWRCCERSG